MIVSERIFMRSRAEWGKELSSIVRSTQGNVREMEWDMTTS